jgi:NAD(P)-dependent dehydrogenase (short-subunit alcohol dehydrogenase family)
VLEQFSLAGRRALVTGAGRGIGQAIAVGLADAGSAVALVARSAEQLERTRGIISARCGTASAVLAHDLATAAPRTVVDSAEEAFDGPIDIIVHAAGVQRRGPAASFTRDDWDLVVHLDLTVPFLLSQEVGARQLERGAPGSHLFIASLASAIGLANGIAYNAAKSGLAGVVRALSREWSPSGVRVNGIAPGYVETQMTSDLLADDARRAELLGRIPMARFGRPSDFAAPAVFLASDAARYVTGQLLFVDGGMISA